jgi:hypothetical protein
VRLPYLPTECSALRTVAGICGQRHAQTGEGLSGFFGVESAGEIVGGVVDGGEKQALAQGGDQPANRFER